MNLHIIMGRLGADAECKKVGDKWVIKLSVATSKKTKDKEYTEWHRVEYWRKDDPAKFVSYLRKGAKVLARGEHRYVKVEDKYFSHIAADVVDIAEFPKDDF